MQFRLTKKFSDDCKIKTLSEPEITTCPLDDWFIDRFTMDRKKIAILTHAKTTFTVFISYESANGAKNIPKYFQTVLSEFFNRHGYQHIAQEAEALFTQGFTFTKTADRKILGHMNDFIRCATYSNYIPNWDMVSEDINNMPISAGSKDSYYAVEKLNQLLKIDLPKLKR